MHSSEKSFRRTQSQNNSAPPRRVFTSDIQISPASFSSLSRMLIHMQRLRRCCTDAPALEGDISREMEEISRDSDSRRA